MTMKQNVSYTLRLIAFVLVMFGVTPAVAQTTANGPYYAQPSWDQKLQCDTLATCPRFVVLANWNNDAVLDRETGLVWERSPSTSSFNWEDGQIHCNGLNTGNRGGWRLPTLQEFRSLVDPSVGPGPALPAGHPFQNVQSENYWSATSFAEDASRAWIVDFDFDISGGLAGRSDKSSTVAVWCVRGGHGVDPQ